jgi:AcrR family transcriptional regulator
MNTKRSYTMTARAEAVEQTRQRILQAMLELLYVRLMSGITLEDVAEEAGVSVQTVLRHFGNRDTLIEASLEFGASQVAGEREAPPGDVRTAVRSIVGHYELRGDHVMMMLAQESADEVIRRTNENGRKVHRAWVREVFAPQLDTRTPAEREALVDLLVVATDVYTWKLLRRDRGLNRSQTEHRMHQLLGALLGTQERQKES